ncbi:S1 family peptidase, partial [Streptomyces sp. Z38]|nr:S1 family peptidase [Streptomyces sp. Z38]
MRRRTGLTHAVAAAALLIGSWTAAGTLPASAQEAPASAQEAPAAAATACVSP